MRALPLWQPWASLVVQGVKCIETRPGPPPSTVHGERVLVHATLTKAHLATCGVEPFTRFIADPAELPLGALIGSVVVERAERIYPHVRDRIMEQDYTEWCLGDYTAGRWAWHLSEPVEFPEPIPYKGKQGIMVVPDVFLLGKLGECTCEVRGPAYEDTTTDPGCLYHGDRGHCVIRCRW